MRNSKWLPAGALALAAMILTGLAVSGAKADAAKPNAVSCTLIKTAAQLQAMSNNLAGSYCLANDIDLSSIANFVPVGTVATPFTGKFFGNDHIISNLKINTTTITWVGLFGYANTATIQDVILRNVNVVGPTGVGGLVGLVFGTGANDMAVISRVHVSGTVKCTDPGCLAGGIVADFDTNSLLTESSAAAAVIGNNNWVGGAAAFYNGTVTRTFATGNVSCSGPCSAGGLLGGGNGFVNNSFALGSVTAGANGKVGGLIALCICSRVQRTYAAGSVTGGASATVGGLIADIANGTVTENYAIGPVQGGAGALVGGFAGKLDAGTVSNNYWDTNTSGQATSATGTGKTTTQLQSALPSGFAASAWAISAALGYPFLNDLDIDFASPLATLVISNKIFGFVPISQLDPTQYIVKPHHADAASLAAVYTMIARGAGIADGVPQLKAVKLDKYFWHDATQTVNFSGPLTLHATLGPLTALPHAIGNTNVIGQLKVHRLVILRGTYTKAGGGTATHYMLATMFTRKASGAASTVVANDPWTGWQIEIDPATKTVVSPSNFPLTNFKVNAYQSVTVN